MPEMHTCEICKKEFDSNIKSELLIYNMWKCVCPTCYETSLANNKELLALYDYSPLSYAMQTIPNTAKLAGICAIMAEVLSEPSNLTYCN